MKKYRQRESERRWFGRKYLESLELYGDVEKQALERVSTEWTQLADGARLL